MSNSALSDRQWKLRSEYLKGSKKTESEVNALVRALQKETGLSTLALRVCILRGLETTEAIQRFLFPRFEDLKNPSQIKDMDLAIERIASARGNQKIRVFGDYDVDGTTGAALLTWVFREMGFQQDARQPDRFKDGYGLNVRAVEEAVSDGIKILVTVDCGITSFEAATKAKELGLELVIIDHHQIDPEKGLPPAYAVINPQRADCPSGLKQVCGCGLAFYFAIALRAKGRQQGWFPPGMEPNLKQHLDLVVMATAADMVPLTGDNHILVRYGLEVLRHSKKPGIRALLEVAGLGSRTLSPSHLGFVLGPRINASGRIQSASLALEMLTTTDGERALKLAQDLEMLNQERANLQNQIWDEVRQRVEAGMAQGKYRSGVALADPSWHEGVVGIVASRVTETFRKPAAIIALREDFGKGSVRSYGGKDVLAALRICAPYLKGFGGHKHAAGLSVELHQVDAFVEAFDRALETIQEESTANYLYVEGVCSIEELTVKTLEELERLGPFGPGNPEPVFTIRASVRDHRILKGRHLKLNLAPKTPDGRNGAAERPMAFSAIEAIWFHGAERKDVMEFGGLLEDEWEWAGVPELNRFRGQVTPTFRVRDRRQVGSELADVEK